MKLRKRIAALGAAMTMAVSMMSIGASASNASNWYVQGGSYRPYSSWKTTHNGVVTGLNTYNDNGITFHTTTYKSPSGLSYAIGSSSYASNTVVLNNTYSAPTVYFVAGWYNATMGTVPYTVQGYNMGASGDNSIAGYAL